MASGSSSTATIVRDPQAGPSVAASVREESDCKSVASSRKASPRHIKNTSTAVERGRGFGRWLKRLGDALLCRTRSDSPIRSVAPAPSPTPSNPPQLSLSIPPRSALSLPLSSATARHSTSPPDLSPTSARSSQTSQIDKPRPVAPIHNLPPELILEIFAFALFSPIEPTNIARRTRTTPLILAQVCSAWRTLALSTPALWSWVFVRVGDPPDLEESKGATEGHSPGKDKGKAKESVGGSKYPKLVRAVEDWIARTNPEHALTIQMYFEDEDAWKDRQPPDEIIGVLMRHRERWRSVDFTLPEACYDDMRLTVDTSIIPPPPDGEEPWTPYPLLDSISLQPLLSDAQRAQSDRKTLDVFKNIVPSLTHLRLNGYYLDDCHFPWSQLRSLALQHVYLDECFFALGKASSLVECVLSTMLRNDCHRPVEREKKDIKLPLLEVLRMQSATEVGREQAVLLSHLTLPALRELAVSSPDAQKAFREIPLMVERSGCEHTLKSLEVGGVDERTCRDDESDKGIEERVVELLEGIPGLEEVKVKPEVGELGDVFLGALCRGLCEPEPKVEKKRSAPPTATPSPVSSVPFPSSSRASTPTSHSNASLLKNSTPFLPNLRLLEYDGDGSFDEELLMKMVRLRCSSDRHLQTSGPMEVQRLEVLKFCTRRTLSDDCQAVLDEAGLGSW